MADPYRRNLARNQYFQEMEYGEWYDRQMANDKYYRKWENEVNARDEWARRNTPAPGSYEEHMAGHGGWTYGVDPYHSWRYGPRPVEEALHRRDRDWQYWYPDELDEMYERHWPSRHRHRRPERYEDAHPSQSSQYPRYETVEPKRHKRRSTYGVLGGSESVLPAKYVLGDGRKKEKTIPRFYGKEFNIKRKWKDWPDVYVGDHPERHGIKVKTKWKDWPKAVVV